MNLQAIAAMERSEHGPAPAFSGIDLIRALYAIGLRQPISRLDLSAKLSIGEGSTRSVIAALEAKGLATIVKKGCTLTSAGQEEFGKITASAACAEIEACEATFNNPAYGILLRRKANKTGNILSTRDAAVRQGALGASIMVFNKKLAYAGVEEHTVDEKSAEKTTDSLSPSNGDLVILGYSPNKLYAERGAWAAVMEILEGE